MGKRVCGHIITHPQSGGQSSPWSVVTGQGGGGQWPSHSPLCPFDHLITNGGQCRHSLESGYPRDDDDEFACLIATFEEDDDDDDAFDFVILKQQSR